MPDMRFLKDIADEIEDINRTAEEYEEKVKASAFSQENIEKIKKQNRDSRIKMFLKSGFFFKV